MKCPASHDRSEMRETREMSHGSETNDTSETSDTRDTSETSEAAAELRDGLDDPIYNPILRKEVGRGDLDYEVYLRTPELLALQTPPDELVVPDELLFQILHQTQELWLKCAAFETANLVEALDGDALFNALAALDRVVLIMRSLGEQIRILFTLSPSRFHVIRRSLGNGSGLESPGYNQMLASAEAAFAALERLLTRRGATLLAIHETPDAFPDLHRISERFVDWDAAVQSWRVEHFLLVRRTLGIDKTVPALDGSPPVALGARMTRPLFPELWHIRVEMSQGWSREGGFEPGEVRAPCKPVGGKPAESKPVRSEPAAFIPVGAGGPKS